MQACKNNRTAGTPAASMLAVPNPEVAKTAVQKIRSARMRRVFRNMEYALQGKGLDQREVEALAVALLKTLRKKDRVVMLSRLSPVHAEFLAEMEDEAPWRVLDEGARLMFEGRPAARLEAGESLLLKAIAARAIPHLNIELELLVLQPRDAGLQCEIPEPGPSLQQAERTRQIRQLTQANAVLAAALEQRVTAEQVEEALNQLIALASILPEGEVDQTISGFLHVAMERRRIWLVDLYVKVIATATPEIMNDERRVALLTGAVRPNAPADWVPNATPYAGQPTVYDAMPMAHRLLSPNQHLVKSVDGCPQSTLPEWKVLPTAEERLLYRMLEFYTAAVLKWPHLSDAQAKAIVGATLATPAGPRDEDGPEQSSMRFAMEKGHLFGACRIGMAISAALSRPLSVRADILEAMHFDQGLMLHQLATLVADQAGTANPDMAWIANQYQCSSGMLPAVRLGAGNGRVRFRDEASNAPDELWRETAGANLRAVGLHWKLNDGCFLICRADRQISGISFARVWRHAEGIHYQIRAKYLETDSAVATAASSTSASATSPASTEPLMAEVAPLI